jgi:hypothetical protein
MTNTVGVLFLAILGLAACSSSDSTPTSSIRSMFQDAEITERFEALFAERAPALELVFARTQSVTRLLFSHQNGDVLTWLSGEGATLKTKLGFVVGTRGFIEGLQASRVDQVAALILAERAGQADRFHTYLDGNTDISIRTYRCDIVPLAEDLVTIKGQTVSARRIEERCKNLSDAFTNIYWVRNGGILQAAQWLGPISGSIVIRQVDLYGNG